MKKILLVHATGLTAEDSCRGDIAANLSDLIAEGTFADIEGTVKIAAIKGALPGDRVTVVAVPFEDIASFDARVGELRSRGAGSDLILVILSDRVLISPHVFDGLDAGSALQADAIPDLLASAVA